MNVMQAESAAAGAQRAWARAMLSSASVMTAAALEPALPLYCMRISCAASRKPWRCSAAAPSTAICALSSVNSCTHRRL